MQSILHLRIVCSAGFIFFVFLFFPGFMSTDSFVQLFEARSGVYTDWHPPVMSIIWRYLDKIVQGPAPMLALQSALIWTGVFLIAKNWIGSSIFKYIALIATIIPFYPPLFSIFGAIWKDVLLFGFFLVTTGMIVHPREGLLKTTVIFFLMFMCISLRHNAVFGVAPLAWLWFIRRDPLVKSAKGILGAFLKGFLLCIVLIALSHFSSKALVSYSTNPWASVAIFDIAGTIYHNTDPQQQKELYNRIPERIRSTGSLTALIDHFDTQYWQIPFYNFALSFPPAPVETAEKREGLLGFSGLTLSEKKDLVALWFDCVKNHTKTWLYHRFVVFSHVLGVGSRELFQPVMMKTEGRKELEEKYGYIPPPTYLQQRIGWRLQTVSKTLLFRPFLYVAISLFLILFMLLAQRRIHWDWDVFLIASSGLGLVGSLFCLAPSPDFRYSHYIIFTTLLATLLLLKKSKEATEAS